jgi:hypothetical protein
MVGECGDGSVKKSLFEGRICKLLEHNVDMESNVPIVVKIHVPAIAFSNHYGQTDTCPKRIKITQRIAQ